MIVLQTKCLSQEAYNYVLCSNIKIYKGNSNKYLTMCSINEKRLIEAFGKPDSIIISDHPTKHKVFSYGKNIFYIPDSENGEFNSVETNLFRIVINDTLEINVGSSIEKVLKFFPKSAISPSQSENGIILFSIYHVYKKEDLLDKTKYCLSYFVISYLTAWNRITKIQIFDID